MSKDKKTEDIIREKLDGRGFDFDEKAWAGMESMLDAQEKKRRFGFFWYFSASMFIALVAGAALYYGKESSLASQNSKAGSTAQKETVTLSVTDSYRDEGQQAQSAKNIIPQEEQKSENKTARSATLNVEEGENSKETAIDKTLKQANKQQTQAF